MPATPAWPPRSLPRLYVRAPLTQGARVELDAAQANYLGNVLRLKHGGDVLLFDGQHGEWLATTEASQGTGSTDSSCRSRIRAETPLS